jgi:hypothetical protein
MIVASLVLKETGAAFEMQQDPLVQQQLVTEDKLSQGTLANARGPPNEKMRIHLEFVKNTDSFIVDEQRVVLGVFTDENGTTSDRYERGSGGVNDFFFSNIIDDKG